ncbi:Ig-like domain-containing protein, partial [Shewanella sp. MMG014]|uniref:Ig-like domain-containing protein n=1 Tax=Shewanella sp. MMG014 TaxID=2822691 RepID=UPI001B396023
KDGVTSNTANVDITGAVITALTVTPAQVDIAKGQTEQLTVTATYSDSTSSDVTSSVAWLVDDTNTATVAPSGLLTGNEVGATFLTAQKDGVTSNTANVDISVTVNQAAVGIVSISVNPAQVNVVIKGQSLQLSATAMYSDNTTSDVTGSVTWESSDVTVATVAVNGSVSGVKVGATTVTAKMDNITSNIVNVDVCNLAGPCISIVDIGGGKLFTNSPSVSYWNSIGGHSTNGVYTENGALGPAGDFYIFSQGNAVNVCGHFNSISLGGRTNWSVASQYEFKVELYDNFSNMFIARGWPTSISYWTATSHSYLNGYWYINLANGFENYTDVSWPLYASCMSNP